MFVLVFSSSAASAKDQCSGSSGSLGCFDATPLSGPAEPSPFRWLARGGVLRFAEFAGTVGLRQASAPADLMVNSPDPTGKLVRVVRQSTLLHARVAAGLGKGFDLTLGAKLAVDQSGSGPDALSTQAPTPLTRTAFGDPGLSLRKSLPRIHPRLTSSVRLELSLPVGNERGYVADRAVAGAAAWNGFYTLGSVSFAADTGFRLSRSTRFGDVTMGSHWFLGVGVDYAPLKHDLLHVSIEALVRPMLVGFPIQPGAAGRADWVMPTDWLLSLSSRPSRLDFWLAVGAGTALPLSHRSGDDRRTDAWFIPPTSPRWQWIVSVAFRH